MSSKRHMQRIRKFVVPAVWAGVVVVLGLLAWRALDLGTKLTVSRAVGDLMARNRVDEARKALLDLNDRRLIIGAVTDALASDEDNVPGKLELLRTLDELKETGAMRRALDSEALSTRRAAAAYFSDDETLRPQVSKIVLDWLADDDASGRRYAAQLCSRLQLTEAVPVLRAALEKPPRTADDEELAVAALNALVNLDDQGVGETAWRLAADGGLPEQVRSAAMYALSRTKDVPLKKTRELALKVVQDGAEGSLLRTTAATILQRKELADEEVWDALERVLVSRDEPEPALQRVCLNSLGTAAPFERLERVLLRPEVYGHEYFGVRIDVATALAALNLRKPLVYDILLGYLVDEDPKDPRFPPDTQHLVRAEGWATLWTLTGMMTGVDKPELFAKQPPAFTDPVRIRQNLWSHQWLRPGFNRNQDMWNALMAKAKDLQAMKHVRDTYTNAKGTILDSWKATAEAQKQPSDDKPGD